MTEFFDSATAYPVFYRTYSRALNGRESWKDVVWRTTEGMRKLGELTAEEVELIRSQQYSLKSLPSGRWLWVGGTEWLDNPDNYPGAFNCSSLNVTDWETFGILMSLAMMGCGTGAVLEPKYINQLPVIRNRLNVTVLDNLGTKPKSERVDDTEVFYSDERITIVVGDSRQGWVSSYQRLLELSSDDLPFADGVPVTIDLSNVRPSGEKLKGFGGTANPVKLPDLYTKVADILNGAIGRQLNSLECCLIIDEAAMVVVAGNIRRCLPEYALVHTESGLKPIKDVQVGERVQTPVGFRRVVDKFDQGVQDVAEFVTEHGSIKSTLNHRHAVESADSSVQFEWKEAKDITLLDSLATPKGFHQVTEINLNQDRVQTYDIEVEEAHCFYCDGYLTHNSAGMKQFSSDVSDPAYDAKLNLWSQDENGNWRVDPKKDALRMSNHTRVFHHKPSRSECIESVSKQYYSGEGAIQWAGEAKRRAGANDRYGLNPCFAPNTLIMTRYGSQPIQELVGKRVIVFDGDQWVEIDNFRVTGTNQPTLKITLINGQEIVTTPAHTFYLSDGTKLSASKLKPGVALMHINHPKDYVVASINDNGVLPKVYCCTVPTNHRITLANGVVTGQCGEIIGSNFFCNLAEVHLNRLDPLNLEEQDRSFRAAGINVAVLLKRNFTIPRMAKSRDEDPIVGVSFTGLFDFFVNAFGVNWLEWWADGRPEGWGWIDESEPNITQKFNGILWKDYWHSSCLSEFYAYVEQFYLKRWSKVVHDTVWDYCDRHNLKRPNRCTTVQPSGTKSLLTGASPGWHPPKAQRFIRRITFRKDDPVALACLDYGYSVVPSQSDKDEQGNLLDDPFDPRCTEWLVELPVEVNWASLPGADKIDISKFSALAQFDFYMQVQQHYTTQNTSSTIELKEHEIEPLSNAIYEAIRDDKGYISSALLARFDSLETYPRLPFEPIDKATYDNMVEQVKARRKTDDFHEALTKYDRGEMDESGPAGCDSDKCMMPEVKPG